MEYESIPRDSQFCRACQLDIQRHIQNPRWVPRWKKKTKYSCCIEGCESKEKAIMGRFLTSEKADLLGIPQPISQTDGTLLCPTHYRQLHRAVHDHDHMYSRRKCIFCGCTVHKKDIRHCPDPERIQEYYSMSTEFSVLISEDSVLCSTCYHAQLAIVKRQRLTSCDSDLQSLIDSLQSDQPAAGKETECIKLLAASRTAAMVAKGLLEQRAMLLVEAHEHFIDTAIELRSLYQVTEESDIGTPRWLLSYLIRALHPHLACSCKQRSTGTLLYRRDGDLLMAISKLLKADRSKKSSSSTDNSTQISDKQLVSVCTAMNDRIHRQIQKLVAKDAEAPFDIATLDIPEFLASLDQQVWKMIVLPTQSVRDRHSNTSVESLPSTHTKKMQCFFLLCVLALLY